MTMTKRVITFWGKIGDTHQLPHRVAPTLVTSLVLWWDYADTHCIDLTDIGSMLGFHANHFSFVVNFLFRLRTAYRPQGPHCPIIMKPPQSLPLQMAKHLLRAQPNSVASRVTDRSISDRRAFTWLAIETGWAGSKRSAICSGKLNQWLHDFIRREKAVWYLEYIKV